MAGYSFFVQKHNNQAVTTNQTYVIQLPNFVTVTYQLFINGTFTGTGLVQMQVYLGAVTGGNLFYTGRQMNTAGTLDMIVFPVLSNSMNIVLNLGGFTSVNVTDAIIGTG